MSHIYAEAEIADLLSDRKRVTPQGLRSLLNPLPSLVRKNELAAKIVLAGESGKGYELRVRKSLSRPMSFSVILSLALKGRALNLIRHNGHHAPHLLEIEKTVIPANTCHVHRLTERYQGLPHKDPESFAEQTDAYTDFKGAVEYMCGQYGLYFRRNPYKFKHPLFE
jgi:hypothetical protein